MHHSLGAVFSYKTMKLQYVVLNHRLEKSPRAFEERNTSVLTALVFLGTPPADWNIWTQACVCVCVDGSEGKEESPVSEQSAGSCSVIDHFPSVAASIIPDLGDLRSQQLLTACCIALICWDVGGIG